MKVKVDDQAVLICWSDAFGWNAVYAPKRPGGPLRTRPIIAWALVASPGLGREPGLIVHGVRSITGNDYLTAGRERSFLGYARAGSDLQAQFGEAARAFHKKPRRPRP